MTISARPLETHTAQTLTIVAAVAMASILCGRAAAEQEWVRVMSSDKKASVLFPSQPDKVETVSRKSPAGQIDTRIARYERDGALLSINETKLPSAAVRFASNGRILRNAVEGVLGKHYAKKLSVDKTKVSGAPAAVLRYLVPDYDDADHPGYRGIAIAFIVDGHLYIVNSILTREDPKAQAKQEKLLGSIRVHE